MDFIKNMISGNTDLAGLLFSMHGGAVGFDLWLTKTANFLASQNHVPAGFAPMVSQFSGGEGPLGMIDNLLILLDQANIWKYKIQEVDGKVQVIDEISGHVVEESSDLQTITEKYTKKEQ